MSHSEHSSPSRRAVLRGGAVAGITGVGGLAGLAGPTATAAGAPRAPGHRPSSGGDLLLVNGRIATMDAHDSVVSTVRISGGRFVAVGPDTGRPDRITTGGTMAAAVELVGRAGGVVRGISVIVELAFLHGRQRVGRDDLHVLLTV